MIKQTTLKGCNYTTVIINVETPEMKAVRSNVTVVTGGIVEQNIANLQCNRPVEGCPTAHINWRYKQHLLNNTSHFTIITTANFTQLTINNVSVSDSGKYECEVIDGSNGQRYSEEINLTVSGI